MLDDQKNIMKLPINESPTIELDTIISLEAKIGSKELKKIIEYTVLDLSKKMVILENAFYKGDLSELHKSSSRIIPEATGLGLIKFAMVAQNLIFCLDNRDMTSIEAVCTRLISIGAKSLHSISRYSKHRI